MRIHHATIAKAKKFQITLTVEDNEVVATNKKGERLASGLQGNKVLEDAITRATGKPAKGKDAKPTKAVSEHEKLARAEGWVPRSIKKGGGFVCKGGTADADEDCEDSNAETWEALCIEQELIEDPADDGEETGTKSVVKAKYKAKYKPTKNRCGDALSHRMNEHCSRENDAGEMRIDLGALRKFAKANGVWVEGYASLKSRTGTFNGGMAMMNVNNRLRAKIRQAAKREEKFDIVWN